LPTVSEPASVEEAASLLARAAREERRVSIEMLSSHPPCDVVLATRRLDRVLEHEAGDLTVTVEAGIRLSALNERLAEAGQMLALDPPGDPTVGACLAGNFSGPRRHRYGAPRDLVLGVTVVLPDGTIASSGGKVVKNVAGYDLSKLLCGSRGTLGLIARASLRLHPLPRAQQTLVVPVAGVDDAYRLAQLVHRSALVPSAVDLFWQGAGSRLALLFEGSERAVAAQLEAGRELLGGREVNATIWDESRNAQARSLGRISFPPRGLAQTLALFPEALVRPGIGSAYVMEAVSDQLEEGARRLAERVRAQFDPQGTLA
jgi:glycolate oxidase FAD binding subunit